VNSGTDVNWYCFDDSTVSKVPGEAVPREDAYLLFYQREADKDFLDGISTRPPMDE
jgi:ubiquitin C-terminal hydrolase